MAERGWFSVEEGGGELFLSIRAHNKQTSQHLALTPVSDFGASSAAEMPATAMHQPERKSNQSPGGLRASQQVPWRTVGESNTL